MLVDGVHPGLHVLKGLLVRDVEGDDHAIRLPVELVGQRLEALLPCRVPDLYIETLFSSLILGLDEINT